MGLIPTIHLMYLRYGIPKERTCLMRLSLLLFSAGKGFVEAVKNKTEEELDEEVRMESEDVKVNHSTQQHIYGHIYCNLYVNQFSY